MFLGGNVKFELIDADLKAGNWRTCCFWRIKMFSRGFAAAVVTLSDDVQHAWLGDAEIFAATLAAKTQPSAKQRWVDHS